MSKIVRAKIEIIITIPDSSQKYCLCSNKIFHDLKEDECKYFAVNWISCNPKRQHIRPEVCIEAAKRAEAIIGEQEVILKKIYVDSRGLCIELVALPDGRVFSRWIFSE